MNYLCKAHSANLTKSNNLYENWLWSRKFNGFSLLWDGGLSLGKPIGEIPWGIERKRENGRTKCTGLWTGKGHIVHAPSWWYKDLPSNIPLQGEAWYNDNRWFASVCNCSLEKSISNPRWKQLKFMVYNYKPYCLFPEGWGDHLKSLGNSFCENISFEERYKKLSEYYIDWGPVELVGQHRVNNIDNLNHFLHNVTRGDNTNWEGLMIANPKSLYICERSYGLLKLKPEYDIEVKIKGYTKGTGRNKDRLGSLAVSLTWDDKVLSFHGGKKEFIGKTVYFYVGGGFSDYQREWDYVNWNYPLGKKITVYFNEVGNNGEIPSGRIG